MRFSKMLDNAPFIERYYVWDGCNETLRMTNSGTGGLYPAGVAYRDLESTMAYSTDYYYDKEVATIQENTTGVCDIDGTIDNNHAYTGDGLINTNNAVGSGINYKVIFKTEGLKTIYVRYATPNSRPANLLLNGTLVAENIDFPSTGGFENYEVIPVTVSTQTGIADIRIEAITADGLGNIDYIQVTEATPADCNLTPESYPVVISATSEQAGNPAQNLLDGVNSAEARWSASGFPQSVVIDYGENKSIIGTSVYTYLNRAYQFKIELDDNADFSSPFIIDRSKNTTTSQPISNDFSSITARYARITVTGAAAYTGDWISLTEFDIVEGSVVNR